ncbi:MAG: helix-turn-helix transcriptional regulator [Caldilineaceae bacterium]|nr:helix-turn-helix transcriptional regulator [Caldilineaceae bacterium]
MKSNNVKIERGSGNVFADLGLPDADAHLLKAELVTRIEMIIRERGLKQVEAAKLLGLSQPDVSRLLRGNFREFSLERLLRLLTALGHDVDIVVHQSQLERQGRLRINAKGSEIPSTGQKRRIASGFVPQQAN